MSCSCKIGGGPNGVCFECKSRADVTRRVRALEDARAADAAGFRAGFRAGFSQGVAAERARVVAGARKLASTLPTGVGRPLRIFADVIERGEHDE